MESKPTASLELLLVAEQAKLQRALLSKNTQTGYAYDWALFTGWCSAMKREALPATVETVSLYLTDQLTTGKKVSTAVRRTSAINHMHRSMGLETPVTSEIWGLLKGAQRIRGETPREMRPLAIPELREISGILKRRATPLACRNRAILVLGFASALRRESLASLEVGDVEYCDQGLVLKIRKEKQDQEGRGRYIGLALGKRAATCPVRSLAAWMKHRGTEPGALFTHVPFDGRPIRGEAIGRMVKASVRLIGLDSREYCGHSLRSGFITAAGEAGIPLLVIGAHSGHRSLSTLKRYFRRTELWKENPSGLLGL
jgi:site-specific recombinase XerD